MRLVCELLMFCLSLFFILMIVFMNPYVKYLRMSIRVNMLVALRSGDAIVEREKEGSYSHCHLVSPTPKI